MVSFLSWSVFQLDGKFPLFQPVINAPRVVFSPEVNVSKRTCHFPLNCCANSLINGLELDIGLVHLITPSLCVFDMNMVKCPSSTIMIIQCRSFNHGHQCLVYIRLFCSAKSIVTRLRVVCGTKPSKYECVSQ